MLKKEISKWDLMEDEDNKKAEEDKALKMINNKKKIAI